MTNSDPVGSPGVPESSMPTGAPGLMPRRSSYASVVSGAASAIPQHYQQPSRSGAFAHLLNPNADFSYDSNYQNFGGNSRYDSRGYDMDVNTNGGAHARSGSDVAPGPMRRLKMRLPIMLCLKSSSFA